MNMVDRVVSFFSAQAGYDRAKARQGINALMNYDGASKGRRTYGWKSPGTSAEAAAYLARETLRNLARDMVRNRPLAMRAKEVVVGAVVGTGILPSVHSKVTSGADLAKISEVVAKHLLSTDIDTLGENTLPMMQELVMGAVFTDGEVLCRRRTRDVRFNPGLGLPFQIELLEADYLNQTVYQNGQNIVNEGVEYGPTGAIEAYHLWNQHPGTMRFVKNLESTRVSARDIIHVRRTERPGQLRGVPWLAPVMLTLGEISDYQEAQILKQRMAALMAGVIVTEDGGTTPDIKGIDELSPGALVKLPVGNTVQWTNPPTVTGYKEFMAEAVGMIAMGIGITRESLSGDLSGVNYSSGRMGHMVQDRNIQRWQQNLMIDQFCNGVERWLKEAWPLVASLPQAPFDLEWTAPRRPLIDPTKEIPAYIEAADAGMTSMQRIQREQGLDPDVIRRERVEDMQLDNEAGLAPRVPSPKPPAINVNTGQ